MDLAIASGGTNARLVPLTVHGVLWLQTHFESGEWEALCSGRARLNPKGLSLLCRDASQAGLSVSQATV